MTPPPDREPPKNWWLENACRIATDRLRNSPYLSANTIPIRAQLKDSCFGNDRAIVAGGRFMIKSSCNYGGVKIKKKVFRLRGPL